MNTWWKNCEKSSSKIEDKQGIVPFRSLGISILILFSWKGVHLGIKVYSEDLLKKNSNWLNLKDILKISAMWQLKSSKSQLFCLKTQIYSCLCQQETFKLGIIVKIKHHIYLSYLKAMSNSNNWIYPKTILSSHNFSAHEQTKESVRIKYNDFFKRELRIN